MHSMVMWLGAVVIATRVAAASDTLDLTSLDDVVVPQSAADTAWDELPIEPVVSMPRGETRLYVTGLLGESFATLADPVYGQLVGGGINRSVLTAGGAVGIASERETGRLRLEVEGRGRDDVTAALNPPIPGAIVNFTWAAADGWSALFNVWRDFTVSEHVDLYLGGGVGGGGYRSSMTGSLAPATGPGPVLSATSNAQVASFAWQGGGGVIWNLSDRVAFDVGYRFFSIDQYPTTWTTFLDGVPVGSEVLRQQFTASELLFGLRVYEPFRRWR